MIDFFDRLYTNIVSKNKFLESIRYYSLLRLIIRLCANTIIPIYFLLTQNNKSYSLVTSLESKQRIIVSLTSFPARIDRVWLAIETILRQTKRPDKIILWLSIDQFPSLDILPKKLLKQVDRGIEIRLMGGDIRSHKKYYYTLRNFPDDYMLAIDDDIFYRSKMIEDLFNYSLRFSATVISQFSKIMKWDDGKLISYDLWSGIKEEKSPNFNSFFGTGGGTLFPPGSINPEALNIPLFMLLSPTADDVWLNAMCRLNRTKVSVTNYHSSFLPILNLKNVTLESVNNGLNKNNEQILAISKYYTTNKGVDPFAERIEQFQNIVI